MKGCGGLKSIEFSPPDIGDEEINAVAEVLKSGWITTGPKVREFENALAGFCGADGAVCVSSATAALELTLRLLGIGAGDEVITTVYTYTATASAILHTGAVPVFADIPADSFLLCAEDAERLITPKTKAVIGVDFGGMMCDYGKIKAVCEAKRGLFRPSSKLQAALGRVAVIADAAHSIGAQYGGVKSGAAADFTCFSFHAVKNVTTAEGGAVLWCGIPHIESAEIHKRLSVLALHGQTKDAFEKMKLGGWEYDIILPAYKYNMTDIAAAIGIEQLKKYPAKLKRRRELCRKYDSLLSHLPIETPPHFTENSASSAHLYPAWLNGTDEAERNLIIARLAEKGVPANVHYKPLPMLTAYRSLGYSISDYPNAYNCYKGEITLPLHPLLKGADIEYICGAAAGEIK